MGLIKTSMLALAAGLGVAVERLSDVPPVVASALVLIVWFVLLRGVRNRAE